MGQGTLEKKLLVYFNVSWCLFYNRTQNNKKGGESFLVSCFSTNNMIQRVPKAKAAGIICPGQKKSPLDTVILYGPGVVLSNTLLGSGATLL